MATGPPGWIINPPGNTRSLYDGRIQTVDSQFHYKLGRFKPAKRRLSRVRECENYANDNTDTSNPAAASGVNVTQRSHSVFAQDQAQFFRRPASDFGSIQSPVLHGWIARRLSRRRRPPLSGNRVSIANARLYRRCFSRLSFS